MIFSIITVNYNNKIGLEKTISSVVNQDFKDFEYIIIDADSTDGSVEVIKDNYQIFSQIVIEKDNGIYDGMNKGIKLAKGEYIYFLNSGDIFYSDNILTKIMNNKNDTDFIFGSILLKYKKGNFVETPPSMLRFSYLVRHGINHQATFTKKEWFTRNGIYDTDLKYVNDWKYLIMSLCKSNASYEVVNEIITEYDPYGLSAKRSEVVYNEKNEVLKGEFNMFLNDLEFILKFEKFTYKGILNKFQMIKRTMLK